ncbi:MAG: hypothetical protein R3A48_22415 [Polyangiales bacterium]
MHVSASSLRGPALVVGAIAVLFARAPQREAAAQPRTLSLPTGCSDGELVVADGSRGFRCRPIRQALRLAGCDRGDFIVADSGGELRCEAPSRTPWGARHLLPECSSGSHLESEGFGRWRCAESALPRCSSGESLVSEGSGRWRCVEGPLPRCSSGEIAVSEGSGRWRCASQSR